jgi:radical SAM protein with 4Fe4S-binding SPASM domain
MQKHDQITVSPKCLIHKGYNRTAIFDLTQSKHWYLPNEWGDILSNTSEISIDELQTKLTTSSQSEIENDLIFLLRNKIININPITTIRNENNQPYILKNFKTICSVSFSKPLSKPFIEAVNHLKFEKLELHFFGKKNLLNCMQSIKELNFESLELHITYPQLKRLNLDELIARTTRLKTICITETPFEYKEKYKNVQLNKYKEYQNREFNTDLLQLKGNEQFHAYYNRRIHVHEDGFIYNSPYTDHSFGNLFEQSICEVYESEEFQHIWHAKKELIDVCRDCEFRGICIDRRPLTERKNGTWYTNESCSYNPYLCAFESDETYRSLEDCGIRSTPQGFKIIVDQFIETKADRPDSNIAFEPNTQLFH